MSYILDALQRAEAERERGRVPGLKSQLPRAGRERASAAALRPWHALVGLAVVLLALVALGAWWWAGSEEATPAVSAPMSSQPDSTIVATPAPAAPLQPPAPTITPERIAPQPEPVQPILAPPRPAPATPAAPAAAAAGNATPAAVVAKDATPPASPLAVPSPPAAATPAPASKAVPSFGELSAEARAQLPAVNVSGSTYSQNPALRMLIANGKVVQEGQDIAPGLRLETIGPRSAVLNHQGLRYSIGY
jgi:general secretion pathway protein B